MLNQKNNIRIFYLVFLLIFTAIFRFATTQTIAIGGDEVHYFDCAWTITHYPSAYILDHQSTRWGIILPLALFRTLLGSTTFVFYLVPFLISLGTSFVLFKLGEKLHSPLAGLLAGVFYTLFPGLIGCSSSNPPEIYIPFYLILSFFFLYKSAESSNSKQHWIYLTLGSLAFFLAYLSKITAVFFLPAVIIWFLVNQKKNKKDLLIFLGLFVFLVGLEALIYRLFWNEPLGAVSVISRSHLGPENMRTMTIVKTFPELFRRYSPGIFRWYWWPVMLGTAIALIYLIRQKIIKEYAFLFIGIISFLFFHTFGIKSLNPIVTFEPFETRYFVTLTPLPMLVIALALAQFVLKHNWTSYINWKTVTSFGVVFLLGYAAVYEFSLLPEKWLGREYHLLHLQNHPIFLVDKDKTLAETAIKNNYPIIGFQPNNPVDSTKLVSTFNYLYKHPNMITKNIAITPLANPAGKVVFLTNATPEDYPKAKKVLLLQSEPYRLVIISKAEADDIIKNNIRRKY